MPYVQDNLTRAIDLFASVEERPWSQVGSLLNQVEVTNHWHGKASSFSDWLRSFAQTIGLGEASLWRYLASARYYEKLQQTLNGRGVPCPPLKDLPAKVSPESLELLSKLERVAPNEQLQSIAARVVNGAITRAELRRTWEAYRPALAGRTARGKGVDAPTIDPYDTVQFQSVLEAQIITTLSSADPAWTGIIKPECYEIFHNVQPEFAQSERERFEFDAVVVSRAKKFDQLDFHVIEIRGNHVANPKVGALLERQFQYCHFFWLALDARSQGTGSHVLPDSVGLLVAKEGSIRVLRPAKRFLGERTGELAKGLLIKPKQH